MNFTKDSTRYFHLVQPATGGKGLLSQIPPVTNTWYTVLDTALLGYVNVCLVTLKMAQTNDEAAAKNSQIRATIDGVTIPTGITDRSLTNSAETAAYLFARAIQNDWGNQVNTSDGTKFICTSYELYATNLIIEVRLTSAVGTNQKLYAQTVFGRML